MSRYNISTDLASFRRLAEQNSLRSKRSIAKEMAIIVKRQKLEGNIDSNNFKLDTASVYYDGKTDKGETVTLSAKKTPTMYEFSYKVPSEKIANEDFCERVAYNNMQDHSVTPTYEMTYQDKNSETFTNSYLKMVSNLDKTKSMLIKPYREIPVDSIYKNTPLPALKTEKGETKTTFIPTMKAFYYGDINLKHLFDSAGDINNDNLSDELMANFVNGINEDSPDRYNEFKEQYNNIKNIETLKATYREEVFDKPIVLAGIAYDVTQENIREGN